MGLYLYIYIYGYVNLHICDHIEEHFPLVDDKVMSFPHDTYFHTTHCMEGGRMTGFLNIDRPA